jgi:hypothetical protein
MKFPWLGEFTHEWVIVYREPKAPLFGAQTRPYDLEANVLRDFANLKGASLYRRRVWKSRRFRLIKAKSWDEA